LFIQGNWAARAPGYCVGRSRGELGGLGEALFFIRYKEFVPEGYEANGMVVLYATSCGMGNANALSCASITVSIVSFTPTTSSPVEP
jgi:hypothetical protein